MSSKKDAKKDKKEKKGGKSGANVQTAKLTDMEMKQFREAFQLFDKNNDGQITANELLIVMHQLGFNSTEQEIKRMIAEVDKNYNDMVEFEEFVEMMQRHKYLADQEAELRNAFKTFDQNGDGWISKDELRFVMNNLGESLTDAELDAMMREADTNGDGKVNYDEFVRMWMQHK